MLYDICLFIFSIFYIPSLVFKGKLDRNFHERFGIYDSRKRRLLEAGKGRIWIQAVSVGEVALLRRLIPELKREFPRHEILLSTITGAGRALADKLFSRDCIVIYFPVDFSFIVDRAVDMIKPACYIMVETEIWPNVLKALSRRGIGCLIVNGRISDRSFGKYRMVKPFLRDILNKIEIFCMQSQSDRDRIVALGAPIDRVRVTGNMKFDADETAPKDVSTGARKILAIGEGEELLVAGSTHRGEDEIVLDVYKGLVKEFPRLKLVIAPRHIERVTKIERLAKRAALDTVRVSRLNGLQSSGLRPHVYILDTMGQLNGIFSIATLVFMGGSLVRHGGHNPIEPAVFEKPILFGPYMYNFRAIASLFIENQAALQVRDKKELSEKCVLLLRDSSRRAALGRNAKELVRRNRGATARGLKAIRSVLKGAS